MILLLKKNSLLAPFNCVFEYRTDRHCCRNETKTTRDDNNSLGVLHEFDYFWKKTKMILSISDRAKFSVISQIIKQFRFI